MIAFIQEVVSLDNGCTFLKLIAQKLYVNEAKFMQIKYSCGRRKKIASPAKILRKAQISNFLQTKINIVCCKLATCLRW